jgi:hypothetical protein
LNVSSTRRWAAASPGGLIGVEKSAVGKINSIELTDPGAWRGASYLYASDPDGSRSS